MFLWDIRNALILISSYLQTDTLNGDDVCLDHSANIVVDFLECRAFQGRQLHHSHSWTSRMMVAWYGNVFHKTGPLWGKSSVTGGFPSQSASNADLSCIHDISISKLMGKIKLPGIWDHVMPMGWQGNVSENFYGSAIYNVTLLNIFPGNRWIRMMIMYSGLAKNDAFKSFRKFIDCSLNSSK